MSGQAGWLAALVAMFKLKGIEGDGAKDAKAPHLEGAAHTPLETHAVLHVVRIN